MINIPVFFTLIRIMLIPLFVILFYLPVSWNHIAAVIVFGLAMATDWLDGVLARKLGQVTAFGAFLDPVADKLLVAVALFLVVGEPYFVYITIPAAIIVCREIIITALRELMAVLGNRTGIAVNRAGKVKAASQIFSLLLLIAYKADYSIYIKYVGVVMLYVAAALTIWSAIVYWKLAWPDLTLASEKQ